MTVTLESLLVRIKRDVAIKAKASERKKAEARLERARRTPGAPNMYQREDMWTPVAIHRTYEIQICDCCGGKSYLFDGDRVELRHKLDKSARRWLRERGELMGIIEDNMIKQLPARTALVERVIPECYDCFWLGKQLNHLWKGKTNGSPTPNQGSTCESSTLPGAHERSQEEVRSEAQGSDHQGNGPREPGPAA